MKRMLRWLNVLVIFLTLLAYLAPYIHPGNAWPIAILGLLYPVLLAANLLFVLLWSLLRQRYFLLSLGCILVGWTQLSSFVALRFPGQAEVQEGQELVVMTYNSRLLRKAEDNTTRVTPEEFSDLINRLSLDVLCLQEFSMGERWASQYAKHVKQHTPLKYVHRETGKGLVVFSKFPIGKKSVKYFSNGANGFLFTDLKIADQYVRIYNVHLQTNALSLMANQVAADGDIKDKSTWIAIKRMLGQYRRSADERADQAEEVAMNIARSPYPTIVCGDLNDVPFSYTYRQISHRMKDGFDSHGSGLGTTFRGSIPALRIDYIFHDPVFAVQSYHIVKAGYSDHYPVVERLVLLEQE